MKANENDFIGMPEVPQRIFDDMGNFQKYLFFTTIKRGLRRYLCTACREEFTEGDLKQTVTPHDRELYHAPHKSHRHCPKCGENCFVVNEKIGDQSKWNHERWFAVFLPVAYDDIWFRCYHIWTKRGVVELEELSRYHLCPGSARSWKKYRYSSDKHFHEMDTFEEPFYWTGCYGQKAVYSYWMQNGTDLTIDDTFLKYAAFGELKHIYLNPPIIKYYCHYAEVPQLEMLVKMKHEGTVSEIMYGRTKRIADYKSKHSRTFDFSAKKPWDFYRLSKQDYDLWTKPIKGILRQDHIQDLKVFHRLKGHGQKDWDLANNILYATGETLGGVYNFIATARRYKSTPSEAMRYIEKVQASSMGGCHMCPGITIGNAADLWLDYIRMAEAAGMSKTINPFPKDLKAEHDRLLGIKEQMRAMQEMESRRKRLAEYRKKAEEEALEYEKRFRSIQGIYAKLKSKYEYSGEKYKIVIPEGIADILFEGFVLQHCIGRSAVDRYLKRIRAHESYLFFLRRVEEPEMPYYTLEVEPGGVVRQKRTMYDRQNPDIAEATAFLREWQTEVQKRLTAADRKKAKASRETRLVEYADLRREKKIVNSGLLRGQLLADVLEADLLDIEFDLTEPKTKEETA